jgi:hypothetical protein
VFPGKHYRNRVADLEPATVLSSLDEEGDSDPAFEAEPEGLPGIDLQESKRVVDEAVRALKDLVGARSAEARAMLGSSEDETRVVQEIIEEELDRILRNDERFHRVVDSLLDEIEKRFEVLTPGILARD